MRLVQQPNLRSEDFPDFKSADALFKILNPFFVDLGQILDENIDFSQNIKSVTKSFSSKGIAVPVNFSWPFPKFQPVTLIVTQATKDGTPIAMAAAWSYNASSAIVSISKLVQIEEPSNLAIVNTSTYNFTVRVTV